MQKPTQRAVCSQEAKDAIAEIARLAAFLTFDVRFWSPVTADEAAKAVHEIVRRAHALARLTDPRPTSPPPEAS